MSISQRRGTITLLPKEDSNLLNLANWWPITLLNLDYKIASKAIAERIEKVLTLLINPDQTGFIKGRYIGQKVRLLNDILEQTETQNIPGILLQLDFRNWHSTPLNGNSSRRCSLFLTSVRVSNDGSLLFTLIRRALF